MVANDILICFMIFWEKKYLIFHVNRLPRENKTWLFMWIVRSADDSHEMSSLIFSEKNIGKKNKTKIKMASDKVEIKTAIVDNNRPFQTA